MKYERLTKQNQEPKTIFCFSGSMEDFKIYKRLQELEDKIEQGTLIELPCKLDSEIYIVDYLTDDEEKKHYYIRKSVFHPKWIDEWHNMFYLTREDAEKRLKELQNDKRE